MKFKKYDHGKYNLHVIEVDTFRSCGIEIIFRSLFDSKKAAAYSLLCDILTDQCKKYPTRKYISRHMEESYILDFYGSFNINGKVMSTSIVCDYVDPKYIKDKNYLEKTVKFVFDVITNPIVIDNGFDEKTFKMIKERHIKSLNGLDGNNKFLSSDNAQKNFTKNPAIRFHLHDMIDFINNLTKEELYSYYQDLIKESSVDIFVSGSTDAIKINEIIKKYYSINNSNYVKYNHLTYAKNRFIPKTKFKKSSFKQSSLVMIYNVNCLTMFEREFVMPYYLNIINNNGLSSKLYQNLREKNSLCYNVNTTYFNSGNYLVIKSTLNVGKERKAIRLVKKAVKDMKNNITDKEFVGAYYNYQSSLKGMLDSLSAISRLYFNIYYGRFSDYNTKLKSFKKVTLSDVYKLANKLRLNTVYVLKGDINERNQD